MYYTFYDKHLDLRAMSNAIRLDKPGHYDWIFKILSKYFEAFYCYRYVNEICINQYSSQSHIVVGNWQKLVVWWGFYEFKSDSCWFMPSSLQILTTSSLAFSSFWLPDFLYFEFLFCVLPCSVKQVNKLLPNILVASVWEFFTKRLKNKKQKCQFFVNNNSILVQLFQKEPK